MASIGRGRSAARGWQRAYRRGGVVWVRAVRYPCEHFAACPSQALAFAVLAGGINVTDLNCLNILALTGRMTAGELARATGLTTASITGVLDRLEDTGFVILGFQRQLERLMRDRLIELRDRTSG